MWYYPLAIKPEIFDRLRENKPVSESEFVDKYDEISDCIAAAISFRNFKMSNFAGKDFVKMRLDELKPLQYATYNSWASEKNMSDETKLFLKMKGDL
jgi:hypothetical protein